MAHKGATVGAKAVAATLLDLLQDADLRAAQTAFQNAQARRNEASKQIGQAKAQKDEVKAQALMAEVESLKGTIAEATEAERIKGEALRVALASLPNLLHLDTIWPLLHDRDFRYERCGVRDRTHLRFFTRTSAMRMFDECGYEVLSVQGINEQWYTPSIKRRLAFRLFGRQLEETKYVQFAFVARPTPQRLAS